MNENRKICQMDTGGTSCNNGLEFEGKVILWILLDKDYDFFTLQRHYDLEIFHNKKSHIFEIKSSSKKPKEIITHDIFKSFLSNLQWIKSYTSNDEFFAFYIVMKQNENIWEKFDITQAISQPSIYNTDLYNTKILKKLKPINANNIDDLIRETFIAKKYRITKEMINFNLTPALSEIRKHNRKWINEVLSIEESGELEKCQKSWCNHLENNHYSIGDNLFNKKNTVFELVQFRGEIYKDKKIGRVVKLIMDEYYDFLNIVELLAELKNDKNLPFIKKICKECSVSISEIIVILRKMINIGGDNGKQN